MKFGRRFCAPFLAAIGIMSISIPAHAHRLRPSGEPVEVADSNILVTPGRDWNRLSGKPGKNTEVWTLDGEQLNDVTFYGGIEPGKPLVRERSEKRDPLPKFVESTLLIEIPELLERTYRTYKDTRTFAVGSVEPITFLGHDGVHFTFDFIDADQLPRKGQARAAIIDGKLYMITFEAPRLHYYDAVLPDFQTLVQSATLR